MVIRRVVGRRRADAGPGHRRRAAVSSRRGRSRGVLARRPGSQGLRVGFTHRNRELVLQLPAAAMARGGRVEAAGLVPGPGRRRGGRVVEVDGLARGGRGGRGRLGLGLGPGPQFAGPPTGHGHRRGWVRQTGTAEAASGRWWGLAGVERAPGLGGGERGARERGRRGVGAADDALGEEEKEE